MFGHFYQGGPYLEIFSTQDKTLLSKWKLPPRGKKEFDNEARTYVYCLQGNTSTSKIELRKESRKGAGLVQPYLMFQVKVPQTGDFSIEISVICYSQNRRIFFSTSQKTTRATPAQRAVVSLTHQMKGRWNNLCIDVPDLVSGFWKGETFHCLESISVGGTFCLKRIFTMKHYVTHSITPAEFEKMFYSRIPKSLHLPHFLPQQAILITIDSIGYDPSLGKQPTLENISGIEINLSKYHTLTGRCSTESLPCPVTHNPQMQLNRIHSRSQSCYEGYLDAKGSHHIINSSKENRHYRRPSKDENQVYTVCPKKTLKTARPLFSRRDLHKGDFNHDNHETCTLISELGRSHSSSPASVTSNQSNPVREYQGSDLEVTGKKIKRPRDIEKVSATPVKYKVREKSRPLKHPSLKSSSTTNCNEDLRIRTAKFHEAIRSDQHKNQHKNTKSDTYLTNRSVLHSGSSSSSINDGNQSGCEASEESGTNSPDQNVKQIECEGLFQCCPKELPCEIDINSAETKVCESEGAAEQLNEMFAKVSMDELRTHGSVTNVMGNICDEVVCVVSDGILYTCDRTSFSPCSYDK